GSQHENRGRALRRLRQALYLKVRDELPPEALAAEAVQARAGYRDARGPDGRLRLGLKDPRFWPAVGVVLDVLQASAARLSDASAALGVSTGNLVDFLESDPRVWEQANQLRTRFGQKPLRGAS